MKYYRKTEKLGNFGLNTFGCRERDPKISRRRSFCNKVNSETEGGLAAILYFGQRNLRYVLTVAILANWASLEKNW